MKKFIIAVVIAACLALCAAMWPRNGVVEKAPEQMQESVVSAPEAPAATPKEEAKVLPPSEEENTELQQLELLPETVSEPEHVPVEIPIVSKAQSTPEPILASESVPEPAPPQTATNSQPGDMVYVPGFGWLESQGEGTVIYDDMMYENGNKVGSME